MGRRRRRRVGPTDDWEQLELLCAWEEQREYETVTNPRLLATKYRTSQLKLFALDDVLGEDGWLKVLRLDSYVSGRRGDPRCYSRCCSPTWRPCRPIARVRAVCRKLAAGHSRMPRARRSAPMRVVSQRCALVLIPYCLGAVR
jgi:hypothetical protein